MKKNWFLLPAFILALACNLADPLAPEEPPATDTLSPSLTPTSTAKPTATPSSTPTSTSTATPTITPSSTDTATITDTITLTDTLTASPTVTNTSTITNTPSRTPSISVTPVLVFTPATGNCTIYSAGSVNVYFRPSGLSDKFGTLGVGQKEPAMNYTLDGFVGFDPGVAQAGNVGIFRERWVSMHPPVYLKGGCLGLPIVIGPFPGVCYTMAESDTPIYRTASTSADIEATMHLGDYVKATGKMVGWIRVDTHVGNLNRSGTGWIKSDKYFPNGPCSSLPSFAP
jgi:hypothetical protein